MSDDSRKPSLDAATRQELRATIKFLSKLHEEMTGKAPTPEEIIDVLRDRGQHAHANELERIVARLRAKRRLT